MDEYEQENLLKDTPNLPSLTESEKNILRSLLRPTEILPYLYLGNELHSKSTTILKKLGITHILNVAGNIPLNMDTSFESMHIKLKDAPDENIFQYFQVTNSFIESVVTHNCDNIHSENPSHKILIHCHAGISRSATIVIAYLIHNNKWNLKTALEFVKSKRSIVNPNAGFISQLEIYENIKMGINNNISTNSVWLEGKIKKMRNIVGALCRSDVDKLDITRCNSLLNLCKKYNQELESFKVMTVENSAQHLEIMDTILSLNDINKRTNSVLLNLEIKTE